MGFILSYIAIGLFLVVYLIDSVLILVIDVKNKKWYKVVNQRKYTKAFDIDVFGNYLLPDTWTFFLSWGGGYKFGRFGETLSSVLGRKKLDNSLSWIGLFLYYFLYAFDFTKWKVGGHCYWAIMHDYQINNFINNKLNT